jgi:hypothetical protein
MHIPHTSAFVALLAACAHPHPSPSAIDGPLTASPTALSPPTAPTAAPSGAPARVPSPFRLAYRDPDPFTAFPVNPEVLLLADGAPFAARAGDLPCTILLAGRRPTQAGANNRKGGHTTTLSAAGLWPGSTWLSTQYCPALAEGCDERFIHAARWNGHEWIEADPRDGAWILHVRTAVLVGERVLGLASVRADPDGPKAGTEDDRRGDRMVQLAGPPGVLPRLRGRTSPLALLALDDGTLLGLVEGEPSYFVERWACGAANATLEPLPVPGGCSFAWLMGTLYGHVADATFVVAALFCGEPHEVRGYLARFDGKRWVTIEGPPGGEIGSMAAPSARSQWAVSKDTLWNRRSGAWERVLLPKTDCKPGTVGARADDDVWVTAECKGTSGRQEYALFRTRGAALEP